MAKEKKRELTSIDHEYIESNQDGDVAEIAMKLKLAQSQVQGYINVLRARQRYADSEIHLYETKTPGGRTGITVMTEGASMGNNHLEDRYAIAIKRIQGEIEVAISNMDIDKAHKLQQDIHNLTSARRARMNSVGESDHVFDMNKAREYNG